MLTNLLVQDIGISTPPKEGDLYKRVTVSDKTFDLYYGYYEEFERYSPYNDPIPIYPDFIKNPQYTKDGIPFVTAMQDVCESYDGSATGDSCAECVYFKKHEELFGLCICPKNQKSPQGQEVVQNE